VLGLAVDRAVICLAKGNPAAALGAVQDVHMIQLDQAAGIALRKRPSMKLYGRAGLDGTLSAGWRAP
jgi:hypothetical protein